MLFSSSRFLHDGECFRSGIRSEGPPASAHAKRERHPLHRLPLLLVQPGWDKSWNPQCLYKSGRWTAGQSHLECLSTCHGRLGESWTRHQHLLAQLLPGKHDDNNTRVMGFNSENLHTVRTCSGLNIKKCIDSYALTKEVCGVNNSLD